jgi:hypothetical protein
MSESYVVHWVCSDMTSSLYSPLSRVALGRAASAPRGACFPWRMLSVAQASSLRAGILATAVRCWPWPLVRRLDVCTPV